MIKWAFIFLVIALVAGFFGFTGAAGTVQSFARVIFIVALILLVFSFIFGKQRGSKH